MKNNKNSYKDVALLALPVSGLFIGTLAAHFAHINSLAVLCALITGFTLKSLMTRVNLKDKIVIDRYQNGFDKLNEDFQNHMNDLLQYPTMERQDKWVRDVDHLLSPKLRVQEATAATQ